MLVPLDTSGDGPSQSSFQEIAVLTHSDLQLAVECNQRVEFEIIIEWNFEIAPLVAAVRRIESGPVICLEPKLVRRSELTLRLVQSSCHQSVVAGSLLQE